MPSDAMAVDNARACTLPLSDVERVLVIDSDPDSSGAYTIAAVLDPGSQVRIGAVPDIKPPAFLRSATMETLAPYRAVYLIDLPEMTDSIATALNQYVRAGGGVAWFLGDSVTPENYNTHLLGRGRRLLPAPLEEIRPLPLSPDGGAGDVVFGDDHTLVDPLRSAGDSSLAMVGIAKSWTLGAPLDAPPEGRSGDDPTSGGAATATRYRDVLRRRDSQPLVTQHTNGAGTVITVLTGLGNDWTNWAGDPTFVPFMLLSNARLWSGAAASTWRYLDQPMSKNLSPQRYFPEVKIVPPAKTTPRVAIEMIAPTESGGGEDGSNELSLDPVDWLITETLDVDELLRPGVFEWGLLKADGGGQVTPVASVIRVGEGDLERADPAEIQRALLPMEVEFVSSEDWGRQNSLAGSSTVAMVLLALLALMLAAEQILAYWASYHTSSAAESSLVFRRGGESPPGQPRFGLDTHGGHA